jgi:hypothetical protein
VEGKPSIDFICFGAQKAGTTWLYSKLDELEGFDMPPVKELGYFSRYRAYGYGFLTISESWRRIFKPIRMWRAIRHLTRLAVEGKWRRFKWYISWYFSDYNDDWYLSLFEDREGLTGDITPNYSVLRERDIRRMHQLLPDVRLIFMMRNPIERAWSHYKYKRIQWEPDFEVSQVDVEEVLDFVDSDEQELRSDYLATIQRFAKYYPDEQILLCFYDAVKHKPAVLLSEVVEFIGGNADKIRENLRLRERVNTSVQMDMPEEVRDHLERKYSSFLKEMSDHFGSYCTKWYLEAKGRLEEARSVSLPPVVKLDDVGNDEP